MKPGPHSVLTAVVRATASRPVSLAVVARSGSGAIEVPATEASTKPKAIVLGMTATTDYDVSATATAAGGRHETVHLTFSSGSLPANLPAVHTTVSTPAQMAPGITLFNTLAWGPGNAATCEPAPDPGGWIIGVNASGTVVWYYRSALEIADVSPTPRGTLLVSIHDVVIREIDMLGNVLSELGSRVATTYACQDLTGRSNVTDRTVPIDIDSTHHELTELPNGHLLTLSTEVITLDPARARGLCRGVKDPKGNPIPDPTGVVADVVVELTRQGRVVNRWPLTDYFDPLEQPGSDLCVIGNPIAPPNWFYPAKKGLRDWTHANAAALDEATNTLLVSIRQLDSVIGIRYAADASGPAGQQKWILSPRYGTLDLTSGQFAYHGHAVEPESGGRILYYDNGNAWPGTVEVGGSEANYSRAVMYQIDAAAGTADQIWEHRDLTPEGEPVSTPFLGDADMQPNGNILITHGGAATKDGVFYSRIVEVTPNYNGGDDTVVFDLTLGDRSTMGYTAYRADRVPSLYFGRF